MRRSLAIMLLVGFLGLTAAGAVDRRVPVALAAGERQVVLTEMRGLLQALSQIQLALAADDYPAVAERAAEVGIGMVGNSEDDRQLMKALPDDFRTLGLAVHRDFDALAASAETEEDKDELLLRLGRITGKCTACHEAYRLKCET